jgi:serine/threonine-protein kinase
VDIGQGLEHIASVRSEPVENANTAPPRLGRYEVLAKIADGGMASVYIARVLHAKANVSVEGHSSLVTALPDVVAIKMIRDEYSRSVEFRTMFMDEAKIVSRLQHPNIVRYHELGGESEHLFIAMELLSGQSLWTVWDACRGRGTRLRYDMIASIGACVADGLHYAHELGDEHGRQLEIVHRDVNATNVFVTYDGDVKIIDFGLAKAVNRASKTAAGIIKGKVAYMSPEQAIGVPVDRRTDVFALGTMLWELSCDRRLFKCADEVETLKRVHAAQVPDPTLFVDGFPAALWRVLQRALTRERDRRYATAAEFARDLRIFASSTGLATDRAAIAGMMQGLFAEHRARELEWVSEASFPGQRRLAPPLRAPSRFWSTDDVDIPPSRSLAVRSLLASEHVAPTTGAARPKRWIWTAIALAIVGLAIVAVLSVR